MKRTIVLSLAVAAMASSLAVPQFAAAQSAKDYGQGDICKKEQDSNATKGTVVGAVAGALLGSALAGKGNKTGGAVIGGVVGGVAGHQIGKHYVKCETYPSRVKQTKYSRNNCQWVQESYGGRDHGFEVCRDRDGVWRPSGRS
ncbi:glycine zipper 2TM domain-containing protein [Phenylobacterium aquaticum]|uniref:glycine zipper 2TM domain-containing protein n=1 Tax=Phenylobacterium aquaticum TaxID=1763816 RepID=UPI0026EFFDE1|nr:glycine zipper 2TM domain-containing protein [Phenylobacterium aquaticum]